MIIRELTTLYFAFGSNLDPEQIAERCPRAQILGTATLEGFRFAFAGYSYSRTGSVATVIPERNRNTKGILYQTTIYDLQILDRYEGHPLFYSRSKLKVRDSRGNFQFAWVYRLHPEYPEGSPSAEYYDIIYHAYRTLDWSTEPLVEAKARGRKAVENSEMRLVFVYGSLRRDESNHRLLEGARYLGRVMTEPKFTLIDLDYYPGLISGGETSVTGELYAINKATLRRLDILEGHPTFYQRGLIRLQDGREVLTYIYQPSPAEPLYEIPSGDWLEYRRRAGRGK